MKKVLIIGDYSNSSWHPLRGVDDEIKRILDGFEVTVTEDYPYLKLEDMQKYDLIVNYADALGRRAGSDFAGALLGYVAAGGALLTLHNGIIARNIPELEQLVGATFTGHPPHEVLEYVYANGHPIMKAVSPFSIDEEPYMFEIHSHARVNILMDYVYKGEKYPAAWVRGYGKGRSCYLSMGHEPASFENEGFAVLIKRSALWCVGELPVIQ
ncbi:MAG: ThuA domain-containing protein [Oscillospiraceae bacterium]|nr:ThuA domain-containing protein [Oscillospiraceae bacterium]